MSGKAAPQTDAAVAEWIDWAARTFDSAGLSFGHGTDNAVDEAAWLLAHTAGIDYARPDWPEQFEALLARPLDTVQSERVRTLVAARVQTRKPLAYLLGEAWFAGLRFVVTDDVLVPRSPIAELIAADYQPWVNPAEVTRVLDLCTGSGCIGIATALAWPHAQVTLTDISPAALAVAEENVLRYDLSGRVCVRAGDLLAAVAGERFDLIVTNPPYVDADEMARRTDEFRAEPSLGLAAGPDGLDAARRILAGAAHHLTASGVLVMEVGASDVALQAAFPEVPFTWLELDGEGQGILVMDRDALVAHADALHGVRHAQ